MAASKNMPNGNVTPDVDVEASTLPPVVGINFGNAYASIAVFTKEGLAECIANEDGERQIACAISFHGEEIYIGNQAKPQLVKNAQNTITGFRNLLGKKFSEIPQSANPTSAPIIQHPTLPDEPAYQVNILVPAPSPLPASTAPSTTATPLHSHVPTPRSEPLPATRLLTPKDATTLFLSSLIQSAEDFLGKKVQGAVITVPASFSPAQVAALHAAAEDAGIRVLQLLDEAAAAAAVTTTSLWSPALSADRTQLLIDAGASSLALTLLSIREGLAYVLASSAAPLAPGDQLDAALTKHFASEFTKKTKVPFTPFTSTPAPQDARAEAKLRLALEHTKRTISASPGAATCSVESLKDGVDFTGTLNRLRFDMLARPTYTAITTQILELLASAGLDPHDVDELVYVGGTACLPGLDEHLCVSVGFREDVESPFARGTVVGGGVGDPTTVLARGCAAQAALISSIPEDGAENAELRAAFARDTKAGEVSATTRTLGVLFPSSAPEHAALGGLFVPVIQKETALPARRTVALDVSLPATGDKLIALEVWEVTERIRIEKVKPPPSEDDYDDEEEEEEELEIKHREIEKSTYLGSLKLTAQLGIQLTGKLADASRKGEWSTRVEVRFVVGLTGELEVDVTEVGKDGAHARLRVA